MNNNTIVQLQVEAYNARDLDKFCSFYSDDIKGFDLATNELLVGGMADFRERYEQRFSQSSNLHATIVSRISYGNFVIDREFITGYMGDNTMEAVVTYELRDGKISTFWIIT